MVDYKLCKHDLFPRIQIIIITYTAMIENPVKFIYIRIQRSCGRCNKNNRFYLCIVYVVRTAICNDRNVFEISIALCSLKCLFDTANVFNGIENDAHPNTSGVAP